MITQDQSIKHVTGHAVSGNMRINDIIDEHGLVPMYSTMKAYGMKRKTTNGQKHFVTDEVEENFADGKVKGKSRPGRVKRSGASCNGSVTELRAKAKKASGEKAKMLNWCANMKAGKKK